MVTQMIDDKLFKFIGIGIINTLVGSAIMFGLYNLAGCSYWVSSLANYVLTSILSFFLNKTVTFKHKGDYKGSALRFAGNIMLCYLLAYGIAKPVTLAILSSLSTRAKDNIAMLVGMCLFTGFNYIGQRLFVFSSGENKKTIGKE